MYGTRNLKVFTELTDWRFFPGIYVLLHLCRDFPRYAKVNLRGIGHYFSHAFFGHYFSRGCDVSRLILDHNTSLRLLNIGKIFYSCEKDILTSRPLLILSLLEKIEQSLYFEVFENLKDLNSHCWRPRAAKIMSEKCVAKIVSYPSYCRCFKLLAS